jgi:hypothetical protein
LPVSRDRDRGKGLPRYNSVPNRGRQQGAIVGRQSLAGGPLAGRLIVATVSAAKDCRATTACPIAAGNKVRS